MRYRLKRVVQRVTIFGWRDYLGVVEEVIACNAVSCEASMPCGFACRPILEFEIASLKPIVAIVNAVGQTLRHNLV